MNRSWRPISLPARTPKGRCSPLISAGLGCCPTFATGRSHGCRPISRRGPFPGRRHSRCPCIPSGPARRWSSVFRPARSDRRAREAGLALRSCELKPEAGGVRATLEILSQAHNRGLWVPMTMALLDQDGTIVSADSADLQMIIREGIVSREQTLALPLTSSPHSTPQPKYVLFGLKSVVTSQPMGSVWGSGCTQTRRIPLNNSSARTIRTCGSTASSCSKRRWNICDCGRK